MTTASVEKVETRVGQFSHLFSWTVLTAINFYQQNSGVLSQERSSEG